MFAVGGIGRFPTGGGTTPPCVVEAVTSGEVGGVDWRVAAPGALAPVGRPYADVATAGGPMPDHPHIKCPFVVCHKYHQAGHVQVNGPN